MLNEDEEISQIIICPYCSEVYKSPVLLTCNHNICLSCAESLIHQAPSVGPFTRSAPKEIIRCPVCRGITILPPNGVAELQENTSLASLINSHLHKDANPNPTSPLVRNRIQQQTHVATTPASYSSDTSEAESDFSQQHYGIRRLSFDRPLVVTFQDDTPNKPQQQPKVQPSVHVAHVVHHPEAAKPAPPPVTPNEKQPLLAETPNPPIDLEKKIEKDRIFLVLFIVYVGLSVGMTFLLHEPSFGNERAVPTTFPLSSKLIQLVIAIPLLLVYHGITSVCRKKRRMFSFWMFLVCMLYVGWLCSEWWYIKQSSNPPLDADCADKTCALLWSLPVILATLVGFLWKAERPELFSLSYVVLLGAATSLLMWNNDVPFFSMSEVMYAQLGYITATVFYFASVRKACTEHSWGEVMLVQSVFGAILIIPLWIEFEFSSFWKEMSGGIPHVLKLLAFGLMYEVLFGILLGMAFTAKLVKLTFSFQLVHLLSMHGLLASVVYYSFEWTPEHVIAAAAIFISIILLLMPEKHVPAK